MVWTTDRQMVTLIHRKRETMTAIVQEQTIDVETCDSCGSRDFATTLNADPWTLVRCRRCDLVFTTPRFTEDALNQLYADEYYEAAEDYSSQQVLPPSRDHISLSRYARRLLRDCSKPKSVDVGCGGGRLVEAFQQSGFESLGIEPSEATVANAIAAGRNLEVASLSDLPDNTFDCATAIHVLEHVPSPTELLYDMFRIVNPGGICIIEVPNFGSKASVKQGQNWYALHPSTHLFHFTPDTLQASMKVAGFNLIRTRRLGGAGLFSGVSEHVGKSKTSKPVAANVKPNPPFSLVSTLWQYRKQLMKIPGMQDFARWVNWDLLRNGEFVQIIARKGMKAGVRS